MTRIIAGAASSLKLKVPPRGTRPTSDRVREAIFSTLDAWDFITGADVLDLYAGSGALALEALSRGARSATLVERHDGSAKIIRENSRITQRAIISGGGAATVEVLAQSVQGFLRSAAAQNPPKLYDVVFIDPPYDFANETLAADLEALVPLLAPAAAVMVERDKRSGEPRWPAELEFIKSKSYGETICWWAEKK